MNRHACAANFDHSPVTRPCRRDAVRGHGALYGGCNQGRGDVARLPRALAGMPLPRAANGRIVLAADVSPWLHTDANTCPDRALCHTFGRGEGRRQLAPRWPYSIVAALETGRRRGRRRRLDPEPGADIAAVTTVQIREVVERLLAAGPWKSGHPEVPVVLDTAPRIAHLPVERCMELDRRGAELRFPGPNARRNRVRRSTVAAQRRGSAKVLVQPLNDSVEAIATNGAIIQTGTESYRLTHTKAAQAERAGTLLMDTSPGPPFGDDEDEL